MADLDQGVLVERQCAQLVEQHQAAQDWLREQVRSLPAPPEETEALHAAVNTLKVSRVAAQPGAPVLLLTTSSSSSRLCSSPWTGSRGK